MRVEPPAISEYFLSSSIPADELFADLSAATREKLGAVRKLQRFAKGATVFAAGQMPRAVHILRAGDAKLLYSAGQTVRVVKPDEILGLTEAVTDLPYETSVKTFSPCEFESIGREDFIRFLQTEPAICFRLLQMLGTNIHKIYRIFQ